MERVRSTELAARAGERVRAAGWLHALRRKGGLAFATVRDGWGTVQVVFEGAAARALDAAPPALESVVAVEGRVVARRGSDGVELVEPTLTVLEPAVAPALVMNTPTLTAPQATVLDDAVVANRHPARRSLFRLAAGAMAAFRAALGARGYTEVQTPKIVAAATESGANVFELGYFGRRAYLAQSPQFYKQALVGDRKSTRLNSSHNPASRMPSSA
jgi:nondiscriminating aspartyl-tRNA synthetase